MPLLDAWFEKTRSFVVSYSEDGTPQISEYRGVSKARVKESGLGRYRRRRLPSKVLSTSRDIAEELLKMRIPYRLIFGREEVTIYLDLDRFIRVYRDRLVAAGFSGLDEEPLKTISEMVKNHGPIKLLKPLR